jgi:pyruvate/2-oxoglutarate dehydrogenase complex dihydrolipoamide dehydrogenase (E3) component
MYAEPEYGTVGSSSSQNMNVDTSRGGLEHNDRAILESSNAGFCKFFCKEGTDEIVGATIVPERASEMINKVSLASTLISLGATRLKRSSSDMVLVVYILI